LRKNKIIQNFLTGQPGGINFGTWGFLGVKNIFGGWNLPPDQFVGQRVLQGAVFRRGSKSSGGNYGIGKKSFSWNNGQTCVVAGFKI